MEPIYDWLLHNTGNEGNYFTILNVQRQTTVEGLSLLDVMARNREFTVVNLLIQLLKTSPSPNDPTELKGRNTQESHVFNNGGQVISYLTNGKASDPAAGTDRSAIRVLVLEPATDSGAVIFPPAP